MYTYRDERGAIGIDWARGCVHSLEHGGRMLSADQVLPLFSLRLRMPDGSATERDALSGRMVRPLPVTGAGESTFRMLTEAKTLTVSRILSSRWQRSDGKTAQLLVNWAREEIACRAGGQTILIPEADAVLIEA